MAISPYTSRFQSAYEAVKNIEEPTEDNIKKLLDERRISLDEFNQAAKEYEKDIASGKARDLPGTVATRLLGSVVGGGAEIAEFIGQYVAPETTSKIRQEVQRMIPERRRQEFFDPASGGLIEDFAQFGARMLVPGGIAAKATRFLPAPKIVKDSFSFGTGQTFASRPEENSVNFLLQELPQIEPLLGQLKVNPDDTELQQRIDGIIGNALAAGTLTKAFQGVLKTGKLTGKGIAKILKKMGVDVGGISQSNLTSRFGLGDKGLAAQLKRQFAGKKAIEEARGAVDDLERAAKRDRVDPNTLNEALAGNEQALSLIRTNSPRTIAVVDKIRPNLDKLSTYIKDNVALSKTMRVRNNDTVEDIAEELGITPEELMNVNRTRVIRNITDLNKKIADPRTKNINIPSSLQVIIGRNLGTYLNRSFKIHDDPDFMPSDEVKNAARDYLINQRQLTPDDANDTIKWLTEGMKKSKVLDFFSNAVTPRTSKILKERGEIAPEIRALWGEVKDPYQNYAKTYEKLSRLVAEHKFLREIKDIGIKEGRIKMGYSDDLKSLEELGTKALGISSGVRSGLDNPLKGLFADNAFAKGIQDGTEVMWGKDNPWMSSFLKLKTFSQAGQTIFSVPTHGRNILGNMFIMMANGTLNPVKGYSAMKDTIKRFSSGSNEDFRKRMGRYIELGIIDSSTSAGSLRAVAGQAFKSGPQGIADRTALTRGVKKFSNQVTRVYEAEDNVFKIWNFENLKSQYRKAFPMLNEEALDQFVAQRSRDMMPNYALIPKAVKSLRYTPFGNFVAFPSEIVRTGKNVIKNTWKDISGQTARELGITDPRAIAALRTIGMKRLGGLTVAALAGDYAKEYTAEAFGITQEQLNAIDKTGAAWNKGTAKIFLSGVDKDSEGHLGVDYVNLGPIDPYSYFKVPMRKLISLVDGGVDYNEAEMRDIGMDMALDILSPFVSPSMVTEAIVKSSNNQPLTPTEQVIEKVIKQVGGALTPGTVRFILKRMEYEQQKDVAQDPDGEIVPNRYGYSMPKGEVDLLAFLGIKRGRQDFTESYRNNMRPILQAYERADAPFIKTVTDRRGASSEDVIKSYEESQNIRRRQAQRVKAMADAYYDLGMDMNEVSRAMTKDGILGDKSGDLDKIFNIMDNIFIPSNIPPLAELQRMPGGSGTQLPYNELLAIINKYSTMGVE
tara:strand:+ start:354 stop:3896 length:3543 start_codon:yes stop_codon:yes gene_type:complete